MKVLIVIPARAASARFPNKPLAPIRGATGVAKPLIQRSWDAAKAVAGGHRVVVATDDDSIASVVDGFGGEVVMTAETCRNGTERCAQAHRSLGDQFDLVVNLQGDALLTPPHLVEALVNAMSDNPDIAMATPVLPTSSDMRAALLADRKADRVGGTTAVFRPNGEALYFSKEVLPHGGDVFHHVGVYAYRPQALTAYVDWAPGRFELAEGLEQLRFLENGMPVHCVQVDDHGLPFWEVNNPEDVPKVEAMLAQLGKE